MKHPRSKIIQFDTNADLRRRMMRHPVLANGEQSWMKSQWCGHTAKAPDRVFSSVRRISLNAVKRHCHLRSQDVTTLYKLGKVLGRGDSGVTRLAEYRGSGELRACKSISKRRLLCAFVASAYARAAHCLSCFPRHLAI